MSGRYAAPELLALGRPPTLASQTHEYLFSESVARLKQWMAERGVEFDADPLETDLSIILTESAVERDTLRRVQIDDAIAQTYLGSATGPMLDYRAADYGVLRRVWLVADPITDAPEVMEDDDSLRLRAQLAWEAQSTAGPGGAYVFHALDAHPDILDAAVYGPESGHVQPGEVLVLVQARGGTGIPSTGIIDAVAAKIDAFEVLYANGVTALRTVRDEQSVRPLGARVTVASPQPSQFNIDATLYVAPGTDPVAIEANARERLAQYLESRRRIGREVPISGLHAALHMVGPAGIPVIDEVNLSAPAEDVIPAFDRIATVGTIAISVVTR